MFNVVQVSVNELKLSGRLDAIEAENVRVAFNEITQSTLLDCKDLAYISSAGLGLFVATQLRLKKSGATLKLTNVAKFVRDVLRYSGLDKVIEIQEN